MSGRGKREDMLPPLKRHEIHVLRRAGHSQAELARLAEVSVRTAIAVVLVRNRKGMARSERALG